MAITDFAFSGDNAISVTVEVGDFTNSKSTLQKINATYIVHSSYNSSDTTNDIAMLYLTQNVSSRRIIPHCSRNYAESTMAVCGMGMVSETRLPKVLQEVRLREISICPNDDYPDREFDINEQVCLVGNKKDSCFGDSGGPVYPLSRGSPLCLYAIVSWGSKECDGWGVYTRVSSYLTWIETHL